MDDQNIDRRAFWEKKILTWERDRYSEGTSQTSLLERVAGWASESLRYRISFARKLLTPHVVGKRVVELGCGSGVLAQSLIEAGAREYHGFDIAINAVEEARRKAETAGLGGGVHFEQLDVAGLPPLEADVVFSLGLLDWLSNGEIDHIFRMSGNADFLHSISENRFSMTQWVHRIYVQVAYGLVTKGYVPRYFSVDEIIEIAGQNTRRPVAVHRDPRLRFGALLTSLPDREDGLRH